jgi:hypothetical protein
MQHRIPVAQLVDSESDTLVGLQQKPNDKGHEPKQKQKKNISINKKIIDDERMIGRPGRSRRRHCQSHRPSRSAQSAQT